MELHFVHRRRDAYHARRKTPGTIERETWHIVASAVPGPGTHELDGLKALLADLDAQEVAGHTRVLERCRAREVPRYLRSTVVLPVDPGAGRPRLDRQRHRDQRPK